MGPRRGRYQRGELRPSLRKGTTRRSTTGSGSNALPTADGAPGVPTAPRSSSPYRCGCDDATSAGRHVVRVITRGDGSIILRHVITPAAVVASVVLTGLAIFQVLLAAGRPLGRFAWGGRNEVLPARLRVGSVVSICLYAFFAALLL